MASQSLPDPWPTYEIQPVSSCLRELYIQAICIAVDFLNCEDFLGSLDGINVLERAEIWVADYYGDDRFRAPDKRSELTSVYPDLLNTTVDPHLRLRRREAARSLPIRAGPSPFATVKQGNLLIDPLLVSESQAELEPEPEPESEAEAKTTEPFPAYMEPTLASAGEMDEIIDMRRRPPGAKPVMRVTAEDLRGTGL
ncbi:hypothetical protein MAPG_07354, partial [Magnaporthiopsis poae ATCC 64411]